jgi:uncharacterized protein YcbK (DUF882 family)
MRWRGLLLLVVLVPADAAAQQTPQRPAAVESSLVAAPRDARTVAWASALQPVTVTSAATTASAAIRLYSADGEIDPDALARFEQIVAGEGEPHALAPRLVQLVFKASYHFADARVIVVSGWRDRAGRHTAGEALDFKLVGVRAATLAAWLRGLARVGVGIYTHPRTQYVHLDVRDTSYHWLDGSPPGVNWRERQIRDPGQVKRDTAWTPEADLP